MAFGEKRSRVRWGAPEAVGLALLAVAVLCTLAWIRARQQPAWRHCAGNVVHCELVPRAYGDIDGPEKVRLSYEYAVLNRNYQGFWEGFWPQAYSPNALSYADLPRLLQQGHPLTIAYDPANPAVSSLHQAENVAADYLFWLSVATFAIGAFYLIRIYPGWRRRR